jgi:hypothetical protein
MYHHMARASIRFTNIERGAPIPGHVDSTPIIGWSRPQKKRMARLRKLPCEGAKVQLYHRAWQLITVVILHALLMARNGIYFWRRGKNQDQVYER